ncbi:MAG: hypothetical protein A2Y82_02485 [Candidatus Buchananbacteria bacterium RBG_13_36_9]|uniref:DUF4012 domain-containing protein n=1 Tax=Candidatus Buchananbacteria bacterium RBG_13_36_9 TaxID=1797530 RepID=A0A1G1XNP4_9BACT|nr:MAG: hypothetical protein A2Y82_02485 [Candidatus Buchananbacteria bacterium RBG_13_36_9]
MLPETSKQNTNNFQPVLKPDFSKVIEKPRKFKVKKILKTIAKIVLVCLVIAIIILIMVRVLYYKNLERAYALSISAKGNLELSLHKLVNREFKESAELIKSANTEFLEAQQELSKIKIMRQLPYIGKQLKAVDQVLIAGIKLTDSGQKVVVLIDEILAPLKNESISYATITIEQKKEILNKIVQSEGLLYEVQKEIDEANQAIASIPEDGLVKQLKDGIDPLRENLPKIKSLIDRSLPMIKVIPKIAGFEQPRSYLFLLQNNSELRPTGGFIGTYGILKLKDGEIEKFDTDNIYNLDRSTQSIIKEPSPWPIAKYLEQKDWALRDINWAPDFSTSAQKALEMYDKENKTILELKSSGNKIIGEKGVEITDIIPYEEDLYGVIAMTPEILGGLLKLTGPIVAGEMVFTAENYQDQLELMVGKLYQELDIPIAERKGIIKKLADQITVKIMTLPLSQISDVLDVGFKALDQKQILIYSTDLELQTLVLERGWGGEIKKTDNDYLMVVDSNMASLKTDQYIDRSINYTFSQQNDDLIAKVEIAYKNNADFTWKSTRLRTYTRVYVPLDSELINSHGAMENDKIKDPALQPGQVEVGQEFDKTFFGAFISIEPHETGVLSFEYKLPARVKDQINSNNYNLLMQKQPGVMPNLTLNLKFDKNIKSAIPAEEEKEWFNTAYNYSTVLDSDKEFSVIFK